MQEISAVVVEGNDERYQFTWPDKKKSMLLANAPIVKSLRPCREESVNFDNTENLYIEGDNLEVLKLLQETYLGKVKMIYIDPPYNTGNDFVYEDDFSQSTDKYMENSGQFDEEGNRLVKNLDSNGRFHTDWLNMIYTRLKLAKDLLTDNGVVFISIDDNEQENLKKVCNEVFGEANFVAQLVWERAYSPKNDARYISNSHDYVLMYAKNISNFIIGRLERTDEANARYRNPDNDPRGDWKPGDLSVKTYNQECDYQITLPSGRVVEPPTGRCWRQSKESFQRNVDDKRIWFGVDGNSVPQVKRFLTELKFEGMAPQSIMFYKDVGHSQEGAKEVTALLEAGAFDGPKPVRLLRRLVTLANTKSSDIILDFFSGSSTTAHAIMQLNAEGGGNRKFIMVQVPEETDEKSEAYKAGYKNICEIGKERIRRAGTKILTELVSGNGRADGTGFGMGIDNVAEYEKSTGEKVLDIGFRVLKCDSSNMKDVYYNPADYEADLFDSLSDNIKEDRTTEDLLFQVMLDLGVLLSSQIEESTIAGKKVFDVAGGYLIACFDDKITEEVIKAIAQKKPYYFVMRDSSMANDSVATNFEQIFAKYSPDTIRKVL
jgi:Adenine specific DNA methylase Mod